MPQDHVLVIGGTGMLQGVCKELCNSSRCITIVSRSEEKFRSLQVECKEMTGSLFHLAVNYKDMSQLCSLLEGAQALRGLFSIVVSWIHDDDHLTFQLACCIDENIKRCSSSGVCDFYRIRGSDAANPQSCDDIRYQTSRNILLNHLHIAYHEIILGFMIEEGGSSRYNTHDEISNGVLDALSIFNYSIQTHQQQDELSQAPLTFIVGVVRPWSRRPVF